MIPAIPAIPAHLLPEDGRFGSGPAKIRAAQLHELADPRGVILGTSHRQPPVQRLIATIQEQVRELLSVPEGHEVALGNGGSTAFWDIAAFCLIERRAQCLDFGAFGRRLIRATETPWLDPSSVRAAPWGGLVAAEAEKGVDTYAWPHNDTSTGVAAPVRRVVPAEEAITLIDGTSAAGGIPVDLTEADAYYFAPQKSLGSDGGLWLAVLSPAARERARRIESSGRYVPEFLSLTRAAESSRAGQTLNTPALATLLLLESQLRWILARGGMSWAAARTAESAGALYDWAEASDFAEPFVPEPEHRSPVNATLEFDARIPVRALAAELRRNGVVDVDAYRGVGRNQLRIGTYVSVDPEDARRLTACLDFLAPRLLAEHAG
ncbi:phosphoserine transaminase [Leucobacter sp. M11]|uniref:phosphoserine transaminase n=1 Tax=Leucobacter sp. M11 TaxID=2993565 RepID=UPI002D7EE805|nr:phosphoserine transaminase [Leucobacter sp. M11]MEB4614100.1 phosphoserine transaminase [Leucobacter sp. M11]